MILADETKKKSKSSIDLCLTFDEKGILDISSWMLLRNKESVETPEGRLNETIRRHLREPGGDSSTISSEKIKVRFQRFVDPKACFSDRNQQKSKARTEPKRLTPFRRKCF